VIKRVPDKKVPAVSEIIDTIAEAREQLEQTALTAQEVADHFGVARFTVTRWVERGLLEPAGTLPDLGDIFAKEDIAKFQPPLRGKPSHRNYKPKGD